MKVLIISSGFHPVTNNMGGAIENLIETYLIENEKKFKNDITLYSVETEKGKKERDFQNTKIRIINKTTFAYKIKQAINYIKLKITKKYDGNIYIKEVINDLKKRKELNYYDCIIVENIGEFVPIIKKYTNTKVVLHLHNDYLNIETKNGNVITQACDNIWCVSEFISKKVKEIIKDEKEKEKVKILYNGINFEKIKRDVSNQEKENIKKKYNISSEEKVIIYTGRLMPEKGVKELIEAYIELSKERENVVLLIAGGTRKIKENENEFVDNIKKLSTNAKGRVIFTGNIEYKKLYEIYSIADIQVVPSMWEEAFGLTVIEGMSYSIPVIVTSSGGIPEIVHTDYELMVDRDLNLIINLKEKINYILDNPKIVENIVKDYPAKISKFTNEEYSNNFNILMNKIMETE